MSDKCGHPCHERRTRPVHQRRPRRDLGRKLSLRRPSCRPCEAGARQPMGIGARGPPFLRGCCVISIARLVAGLLVRFIARAPSSPAIAGTALFRCASSTSSLVSCSSPSPALICSFKAGPLAIGEGRADQPSITASATIIATITMKTTAPWLDMSHMARSLRCRPIVIEDDPDHDHRAGRDRD